jgi:ABC-type amino acid transport substrate-binding protein
MLNSLWRHICCLSTALSLVVTPAFGQADTRDDMLTLSVGTVLSAPFVTRGENGEWSGLSVNLMRKIAAQVKAEVEFRDYYHDTEALLLAVEHGEVDAAIGTLPVSKEGEARFDYSHPYFHSGLGIAVASEPDSSIMARLFRAVPISFLLSTLSVFGVFMLIVGIAAWLFERKHNAGQFAPRPYPGILDGVWWAAVTMTFTGYGDKIPTSTAGRLLTMVWMFISLCLLALFSSTLASSLTVSSLQHHINKIDDLKSSQVAAVTGSTGAAWLVAEEIPVARLYPSAVQAVKSVQRRDNEAVLHDRTVLNYMIKTYGWTDLAVLPDTVAPQNYALVLPSNSPYRESINTALLHTIAQAEWAKVVRQYTGATAP